MENTIWYLEMTDQEIAKELGKSLQTIKKYNKHLEKAGYLRIIKQDGKEIKEFNSAKYMISKDIETLIDHINYLLIGKENYSLEVTENVQYNKNKFELQFECKLIPKDEVLITATITTTEDYFYENKDNLLIELNDGLYNQILLKMPFILQEQKLPKISLN